VEKHVLVAQREEVRALPHLAAVHGIRGSLAVPGAVTERVQVLPCPQVGRAIKQNSAALLEETRAQSQVPQIAFPPQTGISEPGYFESWRRPSDNRCVQLLPASQLLVLRGCKTLRLAKVDVAQGRLPGRSRFNTGIENGGYAVI